MYSQFCDESVLSIIHQICYWSSKLGKKMTSSVAQCGFDPRPGHFQTLSKWSPLPPFLVLSVQGLRKEEVKPPNDSWVQYPFLPQGLMGQMWRLTSHPLGLRLSGDFNFLTWRTLYGSVLDMRKC